MRIKTLAQLIRARERKQAIVVPGVFNNPMPAAFAANMTGEILFRFMSQGMFTYKPKP